MERRSMRRFELSYHELAILKIRRSTYIVFSGLATCGDIVSRASSSLGQRGVRKFVVQHVLGGLHLVWSGEARPSYPKRGRRKQRWSLEWERCNVTMAGHTEKLDATPTTV
jgi:hypothetical protein